MWLLQNMNGNRLSNYVLNENALCPDGKAATGIIDCFGSFYEISRGKLANQQPLSECGVSTYNGRRVSNILPVDGSLAVAGPEDTKRYAGKIRK